MATGSAGYGVPPQVDSLEPPQDDDRSRLIALIEATPDLVGTANADLSLSYLNRAGRRLTGIGEASLAGRFVAELHPPWATHLIEQQGIPGALRDGSWTGETALLDAGGHELPMSQTIVAHRSPDGRLLYLSTIMRDIGGQKRVQHALHTSEEVLRQAVQVAGFGVFEHDHVTDTIYGSPEYRALHGFDADEPITMQMLDEHFHPDDRARMQLAIQRSHSPDGDGRFNMQSRVCPRDGSVRWVEAHAQTLFAGSGAQRRKLRTIGAVSDVTERHHADEQVRRLNAELEQRVRERTAELEAAVKELEAFSYSVSHDLRAPLRGIDGFSRLLEENHADRLDGVGRDFLRRVRKNTLRMGQLIEDLLKLAGVTRSMLAPRDCDISLLARSVFASLRDAHPDSGTQITIQPGMRAHADPGLMKVVFENLIGNAWKYSAPVATAQIEVGWTDTAAGQTFFVRDNGVGFDMRHAGQLFNAFQRLHSTQQFEGSGIGLATVRRIVNRHGGSVWAEATPGQGACIYFTLGTKDGAAPEPGAAVRVV